MLRHSPNHGTLWLHDDGDDEEEYTISHTDKQTQIIHTDSKLTERDRLTCGEPYRQ